MEHTYKETNNASLRNWYKILIAFFLGLQLISCDYLEVELPVNQLAGGLVFEDFATAEAALINISSELRDNTLLTGGAYGLGNLLGLYADELDLYNPNQPTLSSFYTNSVLPTDPFIATTWNSAYNLIYQSNAVIEGVESAISLKENERKMLIGEALFLRSITHFYLLQLFGPVPYVTSTDYRINKNLNRESEDSLYAYLIEDLKKAKNLLPENYNSSQRVRPNKWAASALLSRIYLYTTMYEEAETEAAQVIAQQDLYSLPTDLSTVFLNQSPEIIWQFIPSLPGSNTLEAQNFIFATVPPPGVALSQELIETFDEEDQRKSMWIGKIEEEEAAFYFATKYKETLNTGTSKEYSIVLRLAEQYLIHAEASAKLGRLNEGETSLNQIKERAGLIPVEGLGREALLSEIYEERWKELFTEFGHRWFDLKRTGRANEYLAFKPGWNPHDILLPIPQSELLLNPSLLPQNPGY